MIYSQASNTISSISFGEIKDGNSVDVRVSLINSLSISRVQIVYKSFQETDFRVREMEILGDIAIYQIAGEDISAPILSYYLIVEMKDGKRETYPLGVPDFAQPIDLTVLSKSEKDKEILILSPNSNETIPINDLFISISLVKAPDNVDVTKTKIILSGEDITPNVLFAGELLLYYPQNFEGSLEGGKQSLEIKVYDKDGSLYHSIKRDFFAIDVAMAIDLGSGFRYYGSAAGEIRNESFSKRESVLYHNLALTLNAKNDDWKFKGYGYITSEENSDVQPQNRYAITVASDWLNLRGGDSYPRYNNLLLNGKRVRGVDGRIEYGIFNLQGSYGQVRREVEGELIDTLAVDTLLQSNVIRIDSDKYGAPFGLVDFGLHSRDLLSARIGIGTKSGFEFGASFLHAKDDVNSVEFGVKPEENLVASADLRFALDDQRIIITGLSAVSVINSDITSGTYSDEQIDSIYSYGNEFGGDIDDFKSIKNNLSPFFTVNQFIEPLNPEELSSLAAEGSVELNYYNNNLKGSYIYRGDQFKSFGQEFTRTDVAGLNISDRFRTYSNQLFFTIGYENLNDNLQSTKVTTTTFQTFRASVSLFMRSDIPNITLGYIRNQNENDIEATDSLNKFLGVNDNTNRLSLNLGYDFNFDNVRHNSSLSLMSSNREDESFFNNDAQYFSTSLSLNSYWTRALVSNINLIFYNSEISSKQYNYITVILGGRYRMMNDNLELSLNYSPSFGDFSRNAIDLVASYQVIQDLWLRAQMRYYNMPDLGTNTISGVTVRYNF